MTKLFLTMLVALAMPAAAVGAPARGVADPRAFVAQHYAEYMRGGDHEPTDPVRIYSDRLRGLFDSYNRWAHRHGELVGALDFDWWINAQDWELHDVAVTAAAQGPSRMLVTARFRNIDRREEIRFQFVRVGRRWYLDDASSPGGHGDEGWTLSALLRSREE
jgi:hypothetical protein